MLVVPVITGLLAAGAAATWLRAAGQGWVTAAAAAVCTAPVAGTLALFLAARATNGFWD